MAQLSMPERLRTGLRHIADLSESELTELIGALEAVEPSLLASKMAAAVSQQVPALAPKVEGIVATLMGMQTFRGHLDATVSDFVDDVLDNPENVAGLTPDQIASLRSRALRLLCIPPMVIAGRATGVLTGHEHTYLSSRVFTDVRTVFVDSSDQAPPTPAAAVLVHMLRIRHAAAGDTRDFHVALDDADVKKLIKALERAVAKSDQLKTVIAGTSLKYLEPEQE